jgi:hypothetical protein
MARHSTIFRNFDFAAASKRRMRRPIHERADYDHPSAAVT